VIISTELVVYWYLIPCLVRVIGEVHQVIEKRRRDHAKALKSTQMRRGKGRQKNRKNRVIANVKLFCGLVRS